MVLPFGMSATNFGGGGNYANLGKHVTYAIPGEAGNGRMYASSEWGRSGRVTPTPRDLVAQAFSIWQSERGFYTLMINVCEMLF